MSIHALLALTSSRNQATDWTRAREQILSFYIVETVVFSTHQKVMHRGTHTNRNLYKPSLEPLIQPLSGEVRTT